METPDSPRSARSGYSGVDRSGSASEGDDDARLEHLRELLEQREQDLLAAADIGEMLLEKNRVLNQKVSELSQDVEDLQAGRQDGDGEELARLQAEIQEEREDARGAAAALQLAESAGAKRERELEEAGVEVADLRAELKVRDANAGAADMLNEKDAQLRKALEAISSLEKSVEDTARLAQGRQRARDEEADVLAAEQARTMDAELARVSLQVGAILVSAILASTQL
ncbi:hypothetical protein T484DRAFT_1804207 [Baffinella frigidus]|nr:hypothetical protein T484DRAFT_1804207 [Cryptophyta sp. CCMP2293]